MDAPGPYVHWGIVQISVANLVIIGVMLLIFLLALVLPFFGHAGASDQESEPK